MAENAIQYGLEDVGYSVLNDDGTYGPIKSLDFPINLTLDHNSSIVDFFANDEKVASIETDEGFSGSLEAMYFPDEFKIDVLSQVRDDDGAILEGGGEKSKYFALHFMFLGDAHAKKCWACKVKATPPKGAHTTTEGSSINADHETIDISAMASTFTEGSGSTAKTWKYAKSTLSDTEDTHAKYLTYFDKVPHATMAS